MIFREELEGLDWMSLQREQIDEFGISSTWSSIVDVII
jgi:hypothetical protein